MPNLEPITLPSGKQFDIQQPPLSRLLIQGRIPDIVSPIIEQVIANTRARMGEMVTTEDIVKANSLKTSLENNFDNLIIAMRLVAMHSAVNPRIVDDYTEARKLYEQGVEVYHVDELDTYDMKEIFWYVQGVVTDYMAAFRQSQRQDDSVGLVHSSPENELTSIKAVGSTEETEASSVPA